MTDKRKIGKEKEEAACVYLKEQGMKLVCRNFACRQGEADIIGLHEGCLVFVEVKYRKSAVSGSPEGAVDERKQCRICRVCDVFRAKYPQYQNRQVRFDVIAVFGEQISWYQNAFSYLPYRGRGIPREGRSCGW